MGMYTELVLKCRTKTPLPPEVDATLRYLFADGDEPNVLPEHPFFSADRWCCVGRSCSYYHHPAPLNDLHASPGDGSYYIFSRSDLKNYEGEIGLFIDWLDPYLDHEPGECIGWEWYEEYDEPTLLFKKGEIS